MYAEAEYKFDWLSTIKKLVILILITSFIFIIFLIINKDSSNYFEDNLNTMSVVAKNYYKQNTESTQVITLKEMIDKKMLVSFIDENGNYCDVNNSYAQLNNKTIKIKLTCKNKVDTKEIQI